MSTKDVLRRSAALLAVMACICSLQTSFAAPHGKSHSYKLKDGVRVTFTYYDDGQKVIDLSNGGNNAYYTIECSTNMLQWSVLTTLRLSNNGTNSFVDASNVPMCFYQVSPSP